MKKRKINFAQWSIMLVMLLVLVIGCSGDSPSTDTQTVQTSTPNLLGATALSNHYVEVMFSEPVDEEGAVAENYHITGPDGTPLSVEAVTLHPDRTRVTLTTGSQQPVMYKLSTTSGTNTVAFSGSNEPEPFLASAISLNNTTVLLTFNERMEETSAETISFYRIVAPDSSDPSHDVGGLVITDAVLSADETTVLLTTSSQENLGYTVIVTNVQSKAGGKLINPSQNTAIFFGIPPVDTTAPQLLSATSTSSTTVLLSFSEPLANSAADPTKYSITPELVILDANLNAFKTQVFLTTLPQTAGVEYTVTVNNVTDQATPPNAIDPAANSATFTFTGEPGVVDSTVLPRLVGAASTSNTTVLVTFNKPMGDSAINPSNYIVVQKNVNPEVGALSVVSARFFDPNCVNNGESCDRTTVELTTRSQNEVTYLVTAVNVRDLAGNHLAPKEFVSGVNLLVDPTSATFPGTPPARIAAEIAAVEDLDGDGIIGLGDRVTIETNGNMFITDTFILEDRNGDGILTLDGQDGIIDRTNNGVIDVGDEFIVSNDFIDSDGDGLTDNEEQRGWIVTTRLANGDVLFREVTSSLDSPDTDADGLSDDVEKGLLTDPRDADTDDDGLTDAQEFNEIFSDPANQDTDGDSLTDGLEVTFYITSAILDDTDGDQLSDDLEATLANRNPRVSDLPTPTIEVGEMNLQLDVRFVETTSTETRELDTKSVTSTLTQSESKEFSNTNSNTQEGFFKLAVGTEYEVSGKIFDPGGTFTSSINVETGWTGSWTSSFTETTTQETQKAFEKSLTTEVEATEGATVSREVVGAKMQVTVFLKNASNLAYNIRNLQVTAFIQDPQNPTRLTPIATLLPDNEPEEGFFLGPLVPERGPFIFSNETIFPNLVESLMKNPRGLIFKIANFDIEDEFGRNFAFTSQDIVDRTATLLIDNGSFDADGDGEGDLTEYHRVATGTGRVIDTNGDGVIDQNDRRVVFDVNGKQIGISLRDALEAIGLTHFDEQTTPTSSLTDEEIENSYSTIINNAGVKRIFRIRKTAVQENIRKAWEIVTPTGINQTIGLDDFILRTGKDIKLAFVEDLDGDRLIGSIEFLNNCSDNFQDTDGDSLTDLDEILLGWTVDIVGRGLRKVFSRCSLVDTDGDTLTDPEEFAGFDIDTDFDGTPDVHKSTDPSNRDTDGDGVDDDEEINGYEVTLRDTGQTITVQTDPTNPDSDGDTASDGTERRLGGNPKVPDIDRFADSDGDGLVNIEETDGWDVTVRGVSTTPAVCIRVCNEGASTTTHHTSDPFNPDTDGDGLSDGAEFALRTKPDSKDTDGDGLTDAQEVLGFSLRDLGIIVLDPTDADTDNDKRSDGAEAELVDIEANRWIVRVVGQDPYRVFSDPLQADADFDTLVDGDEFAQGTDPTLANTDGDVRDDAEEVAVGTRPLAPDVLVTLGYRDLKILNDCDLPDTQAGDFHFHLGARSPDGSFLSVVRSDPGFSSSLLIRECNCGDDRSCTGSELDDNLCRRPDFPQEIQIQTGSTLNLGDASVNLAIAVNEELIFDLFITEEDPDGNDTGGGFPFTLPDVFADPSGIFPGSELEAGTTTTLVFKKESGCQLELRAFFTVR